MIISISGKIGSGKDSVAIMLQGLDLSLDRDQIIHAVRKQEYFPESNWETKRFADKIKDTICLWLGCTREQLEDREFKEKPLGEEWWYYKLPENDKMIPYLGNETKFDLPIIKLSPRNLMQKLGTECGRKIIHPDLWCNALFSDIGRKLTESEEKRLLSIWKNINTRCTNPNYAKYDKYGGKGIENKWSDFKTFKDWAKNSGYTNNLTLDREDGDKNYTPDNCRWVIPALQAFNQGVYKNSQSGVRGVSFNSNYSDPWIAQIQYNGEKEYIGSFSSKEEAATAYKKRYEQVEQILWEGSLQEQYDYPKVIIPDVRFKNEIERVDKLGGLKLRVERDRNKRLPELAGLTVSKQELHPSETALDDYDDWHHLIDNNGSLHDLFEEVKIIHNKINS